MKPTATVDAIVIGGGPAGLSGALLLGRCRRTVLVFDEGRPRNEKSPAVHAFLAHEGIAPAELLRRGRQDLSRYPNVSFHRGKVVDACHESGTFRIRLEAGAEFRSRTLLIATGMIDRLPPVADIVKFYGTTVHQCPYCDGWESTGRKIGVLGAGNAAAGLAVEMLLWSPHVSLYVLGGMPDDASLRDLERRGISVFTSPPVALKGTGGTLESVLLEDGHQSPCDRLFLVASQTQHNGFVGEMGCELDPEGKVDCADDGGTSVPGLYIAGNASEGLQLAMVAAAEGLKAAHAINTWLLDQDAAGDPHPGNEDPP